MSIYLQNKRIDAATTGDVIDPAFSATSLNPLQNKTVYNEIIDNSTLTTNNKRMSLAVNELKAGKQNKIKVSTSAPTVSDLAEEGDLWIIVS